MEAHDSATQRRPTGNGERRIRYSKERIYMYDKTIQYNFFSFDYSNEKETNADPGYNTNEDIESIGPTLRGAMDLTKDRRQWRSFIRTHRRQMAGIWNR